MRVLFIGIGRSAIDSLAIEFKRKGVQVSGGDGEIFES